MNNFWLLLPIGLAIYGIVIYNKLVTAKNHNREAWSGIDVQLKRRYDLIPNLVATVKAYSDHEKTTFERVINARHQAVMVKDEDVSARTLAESELSQALSNVFILVEDYPKLKAGKLFTELHNNLVDVEEHIQMARRFYNGTCRDLNIVIQSFPSNIVAKLTRFTAVTFFEFTQSRDPITISFK